MNQCQEKVTPKERWGAFHQYQCHRTATIQRDGKWYCKQHDPETVKAREVKGSLERQSQFNREMQAAAYHNACFKAFSGITLEQIQERLDKKLCPCCGKG